MSGGVYAYWAGSVAGDDVDGGNTITIGEGDDVVTTLSVNDATDAGPLVPAGQALAGQVEYVVLVHSVEWKEDGTSLALNHAGELSAAVVAGTVEINGSDTYASLVNITIQVGGTAPVDGVLGTDVPAIYLDGAAVDVYVKVTLTEPADQTEYEAVAGQDITFDVNFSVSAS